MALEIQRSRKFPEVLLIKPRIFPDERGFFLEVFHSEKYAAAGIPPFVQDNRSHSRRGVIRGLHYQLPRPQGKLIYVPSGEIFDVAADIRPGSPTFGQWDSFILSSENSHQLYIPPGFAHGFCALSESADVVYKCTDLYCAEGDKGVSWSDPDIAVAWPALPGGAPFILSPKDREHPRLSQIPASSLPPYAGR